MSVIWLAELLRLYAHSQSVSTQLEALHRPSRPVKFALPYLCDLVLHEVERANLFLAGQVRYMSDVVE